MKEYFDILGLAESSSFEEVKKARIDLLKKYHPDLYTGNKKYSKLRTAEINEAFDQLSAYFEGRESFNGEDNLKIKELERNHQKQKEYNPKDKVKILNELKDKQERKKRDFYNSKGILDFIVYTLIGILIIFFLIVVL